MTIAVRFDHVTKRYDDEIALDDLSFTINAGSIYGLVGRNGAGKTTAIRILLGLAKATSGQVSLFEGDRSRRVGYLPNVPALYDWMTGAEYLRMMAGLANVPMAEQQQRIPALLELSHLGDGHDRIGTYSLGMRQRLGLAQALVGNPDLLILDEPTSALDPLGQRETHDLIRSLRGKTTVMICSHFMDDVESIADTIGILENGQLLAEGSMAQLRAGVDLSETIEVELTDRIAEVEHALLRESWVLAVDTRGKTLRIHATDDEIGWRRIPIIVGEEQSGIIHMDAHVPSLEDVFISLAGEEE